MLETVEKKNQEVSARRCAAPPRASGPRATRSGTHALVRKLFHETSALPRRISLLNSRQGRESAFRLFAPNGWAGPRGVGNTLPKTAREPQLSEKKSVLGKLHGTVKQNTRLLHLVEMKVRADERTRVLRELHDTAKQNVHGVTLLLESCLRVENTNGDDQGNEVGARLTHALELAREADYQLSKLIDETRVLGNGHAGNPTRFFGERLREFGERFYLDVHEDLQAPLELLSGSEVTVAYRIFVEASWNAVKHSRASGLWLKSCREGSVFSLRLWDDGHGFCTEHATGMGLRFMRSRAEEVGAQLNVSSQPGWGTEVEVRFEKVHRRGCDA